MPLILGHFVTDEEAARLKPLLDQRQPLVVNRVGSEVLAGQPDPFAAPDPDPDNDGIGDGQGPLSSDERDIQEAEQEHAKLANKAAGIIPHEDAALEEEQVALAEVTAPDGDRDHTGVTGTKPQIDLDGNPLSDEEIAGQEPSGPKVAKGTQKAEAEAKNAAVAAVSEENPQ